MSKDTEIALRLIFGALVLTSLIGGVGFFGLQASSDIEDSFIEFRNTKIPVIISATEISDYVKRAEGSLYFYLLLQSQGNKNKFFANLDALDKEISTLASLEEDDEEEYEESESIVEAEEEAIEELSELSEEMRMVGAQLIELRDSPDFIENGGFNDATYLELFDSMIRTVATARDVSVEFARFEADELSHQIVLEVAIEMQSSVRQVETLLQRHILLGDEAAEDAYFKERARLVEQVAILNDRALGETGKGIAEGLEEMLITFENIAQALIEEHQHHHHEDSEHIHEGIHHSSLLSELGSIVSSMNEAGIELVKDQALFLSRSEELVNTAQTSERNMIIVMIAAILFAIGVSVVTGYYITRLLRLGQAESLFRRDILDTLPEALFLTSEEGIIRQINPSVERLFGYTPKELVGTSIANFFASSATPKEYSTNILQAIGLHELGTNVNAKGYTMNMTTKDKKSIPARLYCRIIHKKNEESPYILFVILDRRTEIELDNMKREFVSVASHQLRTPLTAMRGNIENLLDGIFGDFTEDQREVLRDTSFAAERLINLINEFLDVSRIQKGTLELTITDVNISEVIRSVIGELRDYAKRHRVTLSLHIPKKDVFVSGDELRVRQVVQNLVDNAIKYSSPKNPDVCIEISKAKDNMIEVIIADNGIGIPEREQDKLFNRFFRASNVSKVGSSGTGLGLYIVKTIIQKHGGKIWFDSKEDKGTAFHFLLPVSKKS